MKSFKTLIFILLIVSALGFADATYLTAKHYLDSPVECSILQGCEQVTTSSYSKVFGVPVALGGVIYYLGIFLLGMRSQDSENMRLLRITARLTILGLLASLWFLYIQAFVLKAYCIYCLGSALTSTILFIVGMLILRKTKHQQL